VVGLARRGAKITAEITSAFRLLGIRTDPDFALADPDEPLRFLLADDEPTVESSQDSPGSNTIEESVTAEVPSSESTEALSLDQLEGEPDEDEEPVAFAGEEVTVLSQSDWTISTLGEKYNKGKLILQPEYQREYVWQLRPELPSRLIESLLLDIPIPPLYFGKMADGDLEVIDGQQRLTTLIEFVNNKFSLKKLKLRSDIDGKAYKNLYERDQTKISDATIRSVVIDTRNNADLRCEVFERLNQRV
jgi:Protein of unknown function DUF262